MYSPGKTKMPFKDRRKGPLDADALSDTGISLACHEKKRRTKPHGILRVCSRLSLSSDQSESGDSGFSEDEDGWLFLHGDSASPSSQVEEVDDHDFLLAKTLSFCEDVCVVPTFCNETYDRHGAIRVKLSKSEAKEVCTELKKYKETEMLVHPLSAQNTHYYIVR